MSSELFHWDERMMYLHESKNKDPYTWGESKIMHPNHDFIAGPKVAKGTDMVYYLQQYNTRDALATSDDTEQLEAILDADEISNEFKGFSVFMLPKADLSFIDILPQLKKNYNNFSSYIDPFHIMVRFNGKFQIFHNSGRYVGQVTFEKMEPAFRQEHLKIVCISDNMKYFVFEGPTFVEKQKKKVEKDKGKEPDASANLLGGLMQEKARQEAEEKAKADATRSKATKIYYVFKL